MDDIHLWLDQHWSRVVRGLCTNLQIFERSMRPRSQQHGDRRSPSDTFDLTLSSGRLRHQGSVVLDVSRITNFLNMLADADCALDQPLLLRQVVERCRFDHGQGDRIPQLWFLFLRALQRSPDTDGDYEPRFSARINLVGVV